MYIKHIFADLCSHAVLWYVSDNIDVNAHSTHPFKITHKVLEFDFEITVETLLL